MNRNIARARHPGELLREHPRRGLAEEGADCGGQLRLVPHGALDSAAHRSQFVHQPAQYRRYLHQVPRQHRTGAPQDHSRRALGKTSQYSAGLRRLPPAAQGQKCFLFPRHGRCRLHALPCQCKPEVGGWTPDAGAGQRGGRLASPEGGLQPVSLGGERLAGAPLRDHHAPGRLHVRATPRSDSSTSSAPTARCMPRATPTLRPARTATARTTFWASTIRNR